MVLSMNVCVGDAQIIYAYIAGRVPVLQSFVQGPLGKALLMPPPKNTNIIVHPPASIDQLDQTQVALRNCRRKSLTDAGC